MEKIAQRTLSSRTATGTGHTDSTAQAILVFGWCVYYRRRRLPLYYIYFIRNTGYKGRTVADVLTYSGSVGRMGMWKLDRRGRQAGRTESLSSRGGAYTYQCEGSQSFAILLVFFYSLAHQPASMRDRIYRGRRWTAPPTDCM